MQLGVPRLKKRDILISFIIALIILAWNMKNSFEFGRLAFVPTYDDLSYFNDALRRYQIFKTGSMLSLLHDIFIYPPHSPMMTFQSLFSYIIFGVHDWSPYITMLWIPFFVIFISMQYAKDTGNGRWALIIYIATTPFLGASVVEFRPDIANGIFTSMAILFCSKAVVDSSLKIFTQSFKISVAFLACALLMKPSAAIFTLGIFVFASISAIIVGSFNQKEKIFLGIKRSASMLFVGSFAVLPYYLVAGRNEIEYTLKGLIRDKGIWSMNLSFLDHSLYYLVGEGGKYMLGFHLWAALLSIILFFIFRRKFEIDKRLTIYTLLPTTVVGYLVVAANSVKTNFLGITFQALLICISFLVFAELMRLYRDKKAYKPAVIGLLLLGIISIQPVAYWDVRSAPVAQKIRQTVGQVNDALRSIALAGNRQISAFFLFTGYLNSDVVTYSMLRDGILNLTVDDFFWRPAEDHHPYSLLASAFKNSDVVVAASDGTLVARSRMPANSILPYTLSLIQKDHDFTLYKSFPSGQGAVYIFVNKNRH